MPGYSDISLLQLSCCVSDKYLSLVNTECCGRRHFPEVTFCEERKGAVQSDNERSCVGVGRLNELSRVGD